MLGVRLIPCLLLKEGGLVKTRRFQDPVYLGDPVNVIQIFNEKEVDELILLDIDATREGRAPDWELLARIAGEAFMPMGYGGGVRSPEDARRLFDLGFEKVVVNHAAIEDPGVLGRIAEVCRRQSVVASVDVKKDAFGRSRVYDHVRRRRLPADPVDQARRLEASGAGEILLTSVDREGTMSGYDVDLVREVSSSAGIPVVASGGAGTLEDAGRVVLRGGASAAAAGSLFVFYGKYRAVLITYPDRKDIERVFGGEGGGR